MKPFNHHHSFQISGSVMLAPMIILYHGTRLYVHSHCARSFSLNLILRSTIRLGILECIDTPVPSRYGMCSLHHRYGQMSIKNFGLIHWKDTSSNHCHHSQKSAVETMHKVESWWINCKFFRILVDKPEIHRLIYRGRFSKPSAHLKFWMSR